MFTHHLSRLRFLFAALALLSNPFLACTARAQTVADSAATDATLRPTTPRQQAWLDASISQRAQLAEELGEEGARAYAASKGWEPVYDGTTWSMVHGPDQVYRAADGTVHMIEAKGGGSPLGRGYGHAQGSSEWAVESAKRVLRSSRATNAERTGAQAVIDAACNGTLEVHVVRTTHVLGEPRCARLEQTVKCSERATAFAREAVARPGVAASRVLDDVAQAADESARLADDIARTGDDVLRTLDDAARASSRTSMLIARASTVLVPVGIAVDAGLRIKDGIDTEQGFHAGTISRRDRAVAHGRNAVGMVGGMAGAYAGAEAGAAGGAAIGTFFCPGVGTAAGGLIGGLAGGLGGYFAGDAIAAAGAEAAVGAAYTD